MNAIVRKLKLYRISTVLNYCRNSWDNSAFVIKQCPSKSRFSVFVDLLYWYIFYGNDFNDYCTFTFWNKSIAERKAYISLRRNDVLRYTFSTPEVYELFLDKAKFNQRFRKYINRGWLTTVNKSWDEIVKFIIQYRDVIAKPLKDYGGHGVFRICTSSDNYKYVLDILEQKIITGEQFIIEEIITNCEKLKNLAPGSLNTIRIVTVLDREKQLHILYKEGRIRAIGVSNFLQPHIEALSEISDVVPAVNQIEISPLNAQIELIKYCQDRGIAVESMSTFSHFRSVEPRLEIIEHPLILAIAKNMVRAPFK